MQPIRRVTKREARSMEVLRPDSHQKVLERLVVSDKASLILERQTDGKIRVTSGSWDGEKVILRDQLLEASNGDLRLHVPRKPDEGTRRSSATTHTARPRA
jgi:hypothetical protein